MGCLSSAENMAGQLAPEAAPPRCRHDTQVCEVPGIPVRDLIDHGHPHRLISFKSQPPAFWAITALAVVAGDNLLDRAYAVQLGTILRSLVGAQQCRVKSEPILLLIGTKM